MLNDRVRNVRNGCGWWLVSHFLFAWATMLIYERMAPQPDRFVTESGQTLMTAETIVARQGGPFNKGR
jgi:nitric oxide reductase large subunit